MAATGKKTADEQSKLFIQTARELGCEDGADAEEVMKHLAAQERRTPTPERQKAKKLKKGEVPRG